MILWLDKTYIKYMIRDMNKLKSDLNKRIH